MSSPSGLKTVFFGTPEFAAYILREVIDAGEHIAAVVTAPPRPRGRGLEIQESVVSQEARKSHILVLAPDSLKDPGFHDQLRSIKADCFCVVAFRILPKSVYSMPLNGSFNIHGSLLPKYRGAAPINWAIMRGEKETGVTSFLLQERVDTGNLLLQRNMDIGPNETAGELHDRMKIIAGDLALETLKGIASGSIKPIPQADAEATTAPKIFPDDCWINFDQPAIQVHNFIRGLSPSPGATARVKEVKLKLLRSEVTSHPTIAPGTFVVTSDSKSLVVGTRDHPVRINAIQREGKRAMTTEEFLRGNFTLFHS